MYILSQNSHGLSMFNSCWKGISSKTTGKKQKRLFQPASKIILEHSMQHDRPVQNSYFGSETRLHEISHWFENTRS